MQVNSAGVLPAKFLKTQIPSSASPTGRINQRNVWLKEDLRMRFRTAFVSACIVIGAMAALAWAADVSGKWVPGLAG